MAISAEGLYSVLRTFENAPDHLKFNSKKFAAAGLLYTGSRDEVYCETCEIKISITNSDINPWISHQTASPNCPYLNLIRDYSRGRSPPLEFNKEYNLTKSLSFIVSSYDKAPAALKANAARLTMSGFYYTGNGDQIECCNCKLTYENFPQDIDPWKWHLKSKADCEHVQLVQKYALIDGSGSQDLPAKVASYEKSPDVLKKNSGQYAMAGFFYTGQSTQVQCRSCTLILFDVTEATDPWKEHAKLQPNCEYLRVVQKHGIMDTMCLQDLPTNVESYSKAPAVLKKAARRYAMAGFTYTGFSDKVLCRSCSTTISGWTELDDPWQKHIANAPNCRYVEILKNQELIDLIHQDLLTKITSFELAPKNLWKIRVPLALAGFFYTGRGDNVKCYSCGLNQDNWESEVTPWQQHLQNSPDCRYVKLLQEHGVLLDEITEDKDPEEKEEITDDDDDSDDGDDDD